MFVSENTGNYTQLLHSLPRSPSSVHKAIVIPPSDVPCIHTRSLSLLFIDHLFCNILDANILTISTAVSFMILCHDTTYRFSLCQICTYLRRIGYIGCLHNVEDGYDSQKHGLHIEMGNQN